MNSTNATTLLATIAAPGTSISRTTSHWAIETIIVWGLNFRDSDSHSHGPFLASFVPADMNTQLYGAFIQDEIAIRPDRLYLTVGTKLEHNYYTDINVMPSARIAWTPTAKTNDVGSRIQRDSISLGPRRRLPRGQRELSRSRQACR